jgi:LmbE family N-acetylglucosaminyl deacetylase
MYTGLKQSDLHKAKRILCIQPHYDDNDLGAGGTLAALSVAGAVLFYLTVTDDLVGVIDSRLPNAEATSQLRAEQRAAGAIIGVRDHAWLDFPDAGAFDYFELRRQVIGTIRRLRPDFLFTCDPWLPYEAHYDHIRTGMAVAEASFLQSMIRLPSDPEIDRSYQPYEITGVVFYFTHTPNTTIDISAFQERKHRAIDCYRTQFTLEGMAELHRALEAEERLVGQGAGFQYGEALKVVRPADLHINTHTLEK